MNQPPRNGRMDLESDQHEARALSQTQKVDVYQMMPLRDELSRLGVFVNALQRQQAELVTKSAYIEERQINQQTQFKILKQGLNSVSDVMLQEFKTIRSEAHESQLSHSRLELHQKDQFEQLHQEKRRLDSKFSTVRSEQISWRREIEDMFLAVSADMQQLKNADEIKVQQTNLESLGELVHKKLSLIEVEQQELRQVQQSHATTLALKASEPDCKAAQDIRMDTLTSQINAVDAQLKRSSQTLQTMQTSQSHREGIHSKLEQQVIHHDEIIESIIHQVEKLEKQIMADQKEQLHRLSESEETIMRKIDLLRRQAFGTAPISMKLDSAQLKC